MQLSPRPDPQRSRAPVQLCPRIGPTLQRSCLATPPPPLPPPPSPDLSEDSHDELLFLHLLSPTIAPVVRTMAGTTVLLFSTTPTIYKPTTYEQALGENELMKASKAWVLQVMDGTTTLQVSPAKTWRRFGMSTSKPISTPLAFEHRLSPPTTPVTSLHPYAKLVGALMYAMVCTRPDLAYPVSVLAQFVGTGRHGDEHWKAAMRALCYLQGTKDHVLTLGGVNMPILQGFNDSSWADAQPDRRSSQGYGFTLGSGLISWRSTRSSSVALSSCEAKLYAVTMTAQEARWLSYLLTDLGSPQPCPTLWCDNDSTIHLTKEAVFHGRSKHIELRYYFVRDLVQDGHITVRKIASSDNLADLFTKALHRSNHFALLRLQGLAPSGG
ncbi:unnamed protein product [Closterium sp. NIES-53]